MSYMDWVYKRGGIAIDEDPGKISKEAYEAALKLVEGQKPPTNSAMDAIPRNILDDALFVIDYMGDILNGRDMVQPEDEAACNDRIERIRNYAKLHQ
jgi:hypothetical protein